MLRLTGPTQSIIVLGMHRSGTSAWSGCLHAVGVHLGTDLLPAIAGENDKGFWEHRAIVSIHDRLLAALGSSWDDPRALPAGWRDSPAAVTASEAILEVLFGDVATAGLWGVKDPRMCRLLPLWRDILVRAGAQPCYLLVLRHPWEVIDSLARRDGFSPLKSGLVYLQHMLSAERETRGQPRVVVDYASLLTDPVGTLRGMSESLRLGLETAIDSSRERLAAFLSPDLRHHRHPPGRATAADGEAEPRILGMAAEAHEALQRMVTGPDAAPMGTLDALAQELGGLSVESLPALHEHVSALVFRLRDVTEYAWSLECENRKVVSAVRDERAGFEKSYAETLQYVEALREEIARLSGQAGSPSPS